VICLCTYLCVCLCAILGMCVCIYQNVSIFMFAQMCLFATSAEMCLYVLCRRKKCFHNKDHSLKFKAGTSHVHFLFHAAATAICCYCHYKGGAVANQSYAFVWYDIIGVKETGRRAHFWFEGKRREERVVVV